MPRMNQALKAEFTITILANHLHCIFWLCFNNYRFTLRIWTEFLFIFAHHNLFYLKFEIFLKQSFTCTWLDQFLRCLLITTLLRAFQEEAFTTRLFDHVSKEITIALFTEIVTTFLIADKFVFIVIFIANLTKSILIIRWLRLKRFIFF